ncbi:MAG: hypothetical protein BGO01_13540 [Armatimonadetes bacterium 55-13]|nr:DUF1844 domain-containing protein [Armatimonadota bacterium]OJU64751.1 MAG: hypothetical protein BGO01_13540 [Armatimonadetes bacterium 55-13]
MSENETPQPVDFNAFLVEMIDMAAAIAWSKLGLQPDIRSGKIEPDLSQAKLAIDTIAQLSSLIEPQLDDEAKRQMGNLVGNLRINFVSKMQEATNKSEDTQS